MALTRKQLAAIAAIVIAGALGIAGLWVFEPQGGGEKAGHAEHAEHAEHEEHAEPAHAENAIRLSAEQLEKAGVAMRSIGPARLQASARFQGEIRFDDDRTAHVVPRLAGVAEAVSVSLGERVAQGQVLAVIASTTLSEQRSELLTAQKRRELARSTYEREKTLWQEQISARQDYLQASNALDEAEIAVRNATQKLAAVGATGASHGLNRFEIRAPFAGTVVEKHLSLGESVKEDASIFTVSDLARVWAEFAVAPKDLATVRVGQKVRVSSTAFAEQIEGTVSYVGALLGEQTRSARARVTLANPQGAWRPGLFVSVTVLGTEDEVALAVPADAVQTVEGQPTLFVRKGEVLVARPVRTGRDDGKTVEVLGGIAAGEAYAATHSFVLKSELGKAGAEHGH